MAVQCRECGAEIIFAKSPKTGKLTPLDAKPVYVAHTRHINGVLQISGKTAGHTSHFTTCTKPERFSGTGQKKSPQGELDLGHQQPDGPAEG